MRLPRPEHLSPRAWAQLLLTGLVLLLLLAGIRAGEEDSPLPSPARLVYRVDVNQASWHELVNLPGIGGKRAREIVSDRELRGPFRDPGELDRVRGIGPKTVEKIREFTGGE